MCQRCKDDGRASDAYVIIVAWRFGCVPVAWRLHRTGVRSLRSNSNDPNLAAVVDAWPKLPEAIKAGFLAMVKAARRDGTRRR
jgi:hypothetical protein